MERVMSKEAIKHHHLTAIQHHEAAKRHEEAAIHHKHLAERHQSAVHAHENSRDGVVSKLKGDWRKHLDESKKKVESAYKTSARAHKKTREVAK
ncbi:hypothetical protein GWQ44_14545 [Pseudomonas sp. 3MA1]|nr:hypothetical protein [Pseudomonas sp. 3MA1]RBJ81336.1 hypothetical protein C3L29_016840 [Pseudomonas sp. MWU12-2534b]